MQIINRANLFDEQLTRVVNELGEQASLNEMMKWALADKSGAFISGVVADVVVLDEFTHDVVVPWRNNLVLVYDAT